MGRDKILELFFENPTNEFQIRGIAKLLKIPKSSVDYRIRQLLKEKIVLKKKTGVFPSYSANQAGENFLFKKRQHVLQNIMDSGLLEYLEEQLNPRCIILFGSFAKAEYDRNSDIDIFVQAKEKILDMGRFEKKLKHTVNILFEPSLDKLSPELLNNIINGIKLNGFIKIK